VTITGTNLTGATVVDFGANAATSFTVTSSTSITAVSPAGLAGSSVTVTVETPGGTVNGTVTNAAGTIVIGPTQFTYDAVPTVISLSPTSGPLTPGTQVIVTGTNFVPGGTVNFGNEPYPVSSGSGTPPVGQCYVNGAGTTITCTLATTSASGQVAVTVTTPGGTSATSPATEFTFALAPAVSSVSPAAGPTAGNTTVTVTGSNLSGATAVSFGSVAAKSFTVTSSTSITAVSPSGSAGPVAITVTTAGGTSVKTSADVFTYSATPVLSITFPNKGRTNTYTWVLLEGQNLGNTTRVTFGSQTAVFEVLTSNLVLVLSPPSATAGTVPVTITTPGGSTAQLSSGTTYTYY
jgi:hypothetical protein